VTWSFATLALGLLLAYPSRARADDPDALYKRGVELRKAGKDAEALQVFQQLGAIEKSGRAFAQMGLAEQALGIWVEAEVHVEVALRSGDDHWIKKNREALTRSLSEVRARLATIEVWSGSRGDWGPVRWASGSSAPSARQRRRRIRHRLWARSVRGTASPSGLGEIEQWVRRPCESGRRGVSHRGHRARRRGGAGRHGADSLASRANFPLPAQREDGAVLRAGAGPRRDARSVGLRRLHPELLRKHREITIDWRQAQSV
jgi:hypothetical protein